MKKEEHDLREIAAHFGLHGDFQQSRAYGSGHINDTYAVTFCQAGKPVRYIIQRVNHFVFKNVPALMDNVLRVTMHQRRKLLEAGRPELSRRALTLIPSHEGKAYHVDASGNFWRTYLFIEGAKTYDKLETPLQAEEAARAFGRFQGLLADLPGERLNETIPGFHDTPGRFAKLEQSIAADAHNRALGARVEINNALAQRDIVDRLTTLRQAGKIPERVVHNDTKINNVMLDLHTGEGICVIDLDTVMPGLALYDFGDMVRAATNTAREDETDLSKVTCDMDIFTALVRGYMSGAGDFLVPAEIENLAFSGPLITYEIGLRFLTDYLEGDVYFKTRREGHNLDRFRVQFKLFQELQARHDTMQSLINAAMA